MRPTRRSRRSYRRRLLRPARPRPRERAADQAGGTGVDEANRHLPHPAPIEAYGKGGFRFADMSHRGSLLCLPGGIWASGVTAASEIDEAAVARALAPGAAIDHFLVGTGKDPFPL